MAQLFNFRSLNRRSQSFHKEVPISSLPSHFSLKGILPLVFSPLSPSCASPFTPLSPDGSAIQFYPSRSAHPPPQSLPISQTPTPFPWPLSRKIKGPQECRGEKLTNATGGKPGGVRAKRVCCVACMCH